jgi:ubiquinone/menaquinone biosynthesis C-methylase UbiE
MSGDDTLAWAAGDERLARVARHYDGLQDSLGQGPTELQFLNYGYTDGPGQSSDDAGRRLCLEVFAAADIGREHVVVDVGFGTGAQDFLLDRTHGFKKLIGVNPSTKQVLCARRVSTESGLTDRMTFHVGRAEELGFVESGSVDRVLAIESATYFDRPRFYAEAARVLRPSGRVALADYCFQPWLFFMRRRHRWHRRLGMLATCGTFRENRAAWESYFDTTTVRCINREVLPGAWRGARQLFGAWLRARSHDERMALLAMGLGTALVACGLALRIVRYDILVLSRRPSTRERPVDPRDV